MHLAVSTCLVRRSRAFFCSVFPFPHLLVEVPTQEPFPRGSHTRAISTFPCKSRVQRWDGLLRHGGPLPLPARLLSREQEHLA